MVGKIKNRHRLKAKDIDVFCQQIKNQFQEDFFTGNDTIEIGQIEEYEVLLVNGDIDFIIHEDVLFFTLKGVYKYHPTRNYVLVDMGAVPFVTNGADIMAAGIVDADDQIQPMDQVWIADQTHKKPLAIGKALVDADTMIQQSKGKAVENIHYIGDKLWDLLK